MLDNRLGRSPTHKEHIQSWACPEVRSRPGEPSYRLPAGFIRRWLLDRGSSATHHRSGGHQPAHQSMINRRLMIVPPAMPSSGRTEQLDEREKKFLRLLLEMADMRVAQSADSVHDGIPDRFEPCDSGACALVSPSPSPPSIAAAWARSSVTATSLRSMPGGPRSCC